jgi:hypothetical protein
MESKVLKERSKWLTLFTRSLEEVNGWLEEGRDARGLSLLMAERNGNKSIDLPTDPTFINHTG